MPPHHHHEGHHPEPKARFRGLHRDWRTWVALGLMLAAIIIYVLTLDDSSAVLRP